MYFSFKKFLTNQEVYFNTFMTSFYQTKTNLNLNIININHLKQNIILFKFKKLNKIIIVIRSII